MELDVYWVWLNELRGLPLKAKRKLLETLGNPRDIFHASLDTITSVLATGSPHASSVAEGSKEPAYASVWSERSLETAESILTNHNKHAIHLLTPHDEHYRHIYTSDQKTPLVLYYRGKLSHPDIPIVGVVGSRSCTSYGELVTKTAVTDLVGQGNIIASGLSFGIDALAHKTTLNNQGVTYAFVPSGLHKAQPASHTALMEQIADTGAVIKAYPFGKEALPFRFIGRNSVLASWCDTVLVIEARTNSGSMNTARSALKKGKHVLAVPNSLLEPHSSGTNLLLAEGAQVYLNDRLQGCDHTPLQSVIESSSFSSSSSSSSLSSSSFLSSCSSFCSTHHHDEEAIIKLLRSQPRTTAEIKTLVPDSTLSVMESLSNMELADKIMFRPDGRWHLVGGL